MRRLSDSEILEIYGKLSPILKSFDYWNFQRYLVQKSLFAYEDGKKRVYVIFPLDELAGRDDVIKQNIVQLIEQYKIKFNRNSLEVISRLIARATFRALDILLHEKFLLPLTNVIFFQYKGLHASHTGIGLVLNYSLFINIITRLINNDKRKLLEEMDYITSQIAHELTHKVDVEGDLTYDNILYATDIFADGVARFTEYIVTSLYFDHGFPNQIEDATRYILGIKRGYHQPYGKRYWLGLYICMVIFINEFREKIKVIEDLKRFPNMGFYQQINFLKHFRVYVRRNKLKSEFRKIGLAVRAELIECKKLENLLILFRKAEQSLNLKKRLSNIGD